MVDSVECVREKGSANIRGKGQKTTMYSEFMNVPEKQGVNTRVLRKIPERNVL